jgi:hypothetical protein
MLGRYRELHHVIPDCAALPMELEIRCDSRKYRGQSRPSVSLVAGGPPGCKWPDSGANASPYTLFWYATAPMSWKLLSVKSYPAAMSRPQVNLGLLRCTSELHHRSEHLRFTGVGYAEHVVEYHGDTHRHMSIGKLRRKHHAHILDMTSARAAPGAKLPGDGGALVKTAIFKGGASKTLST